MPNPLCKLISFVKRHPLLVLCSLALFLRVGYTVSLGNNPVSPIRDQALYRRLADTLLARGEIMIVSSIQEEKIDVTNGKGAIPEWVAEKDMALGAIPVDKPTSFWDPLYIYIYAGFKAANLGSPIFLRLLNALFGTLTVLVAWKLGLLLAGKRTAFLLGLAIALYPYYIYYTAIIMPETLNMLLLGSVMLGCVYATVKPGIVRGLLLGAAVALLALTRSNIIVFFPFLLLYLLLAHRKTTLFSKRLLSVLAAVIAFSAVMAPWVMRNYTVHSRFILMPQRTGINLWMRNHPRVMEPELAAAGQSIPQDMLSNLKKTDLLEFPTDAPKDEFIRNQVFNSRMTEFLSANPGYFAYMSWLRLGDFLAVVGPGERSLAAMLGGWLSYGIAIPLAIAGIWISRRKLRELWIFHLLIAYYVVSHALMHGGIQYRLPIDQFILLFAVLALVHFWERIRKLPSESPEGELAL